jgi:hypothetical protein
MPLTSATRAPLGTLASGFRLPDTDGQVVSLPHALIQGQPSGIENEVGNGDRLGGLQGQVEGEGAVPCQRRDVAGDRRCHRWKRKQRKRE